MPVKVINSAKQLTTVSIPSGTVCEEHSFQAFSDKNFIVRGYQSVDFEFSHLELYESSDSSVEERDLSGDTVTEITSLPIFNSILQILRDCVDDKEVLGSGIFSVEGNVLYSSLPQTTLFNTIREFEVRSEKNLVSVKQMYLELENKENSYLSLSKLTE